MSYARADLENLDREQARLAERRDLEHEYRDALDLHETRAAHYHSAHMQQQLVPCPCCRPGRRCPLSTWHDSRERWNHATWEWDDSKPWLVPASIARQALRHRRGVRGIAWRLSHVRVS